MLALAALWLLGSRRDESTPASSPTPTPTPTQPERAYTPLDERSAAELDRLATAERSPVTSSPVTSSPASTPASTPVTSTPATSTATTATTSTPASTRVTSSPVVPATQYERSVIQNARWTLSPSLGALGDSIARSREVPWSYGTPLTSDNLALAQLPLTPGLRELVRYLRTHTGLSIGSARGSSVQAPARNAQGNLRNRDVHEDGRAADVMTSNVAIGTALADWLLQNAAALGIQQIIWHRGYWSSARPSSRRAHSYGAYTGRSPHTDHVHLEVSAPWAFDVARMRAALEQVAPLTLPGRAQR